MTTHVSMFLLTFKDIEVVLSVPKKIEQAYQAIQEIFIFTITHHFQEKLNDLSTIDTEKRPLLNIIFFSLST
jgi:hypothetical protein